MAITGNAGVGARGTSMPHAGGGAGIDMTGRNNFGLNVNAGKPSQLLFHIQIMSIQSKWPQNFLFEALNRSVDID